MKTLPDLATSMAEITVLIQRCTRCPLHAGRTLAVPGEGPCPAPAAIIGEGPGAAEDRTGRPFVGPAGRLMDDMLAEAGIPREKLWIGNVVKCRAHVSGHDRPPTPAEAAACAQWLERQLGLVRPSAILCAGRTAATTLLSTATTVGELRGRIHRSDRWAPWIVVTYHPAHVLRSGGAGPARQAFLEDLDLLRRAVRVEIGTRRTPWMEEALEALSTPGTTIPHPSCEPPWKTPPRGTVPHELAHRLLGPGQPPGDRRVYLDTRNLHPAWRHGDALRALLERFAAQALGARGIGPLRGHEEDGSPRNPEGAPLVSAPAEC